MVSDSRILVWFKESFHLFLVMENSPYFKIYFSYTSKAKCCVFQIFLSVSLHLLLHEYKIFIQSVSEAKTSNIIIIKSVDIFIVFFKPFIGTQKDLINYIGKKWLIRPK